MTKRIRKTIDEFFKESGYGDDKDGCIFYTIKGGKYDGRTDCAEPSEMLEDFIKWTDDKAGRSDTKRKVIFEKTKKRKIK